MSAWVASDRHIASIVAAYVIPKDQQMVADLLKQANLKSVNFRYKERTKFTPVNMSLAVDLSTKDVLSLCHSLDHQSCEHETWFDSRAHNYLHWIASCAGWDLQTEGTTGKWSI